MILPVIEMPEIPLYPAVTVGQEETFVTDVLYTLVPSVPAAEQVLPGLQATVPLVLVKLSTT